MKIHSDEGKKVCININEISHFRESDEGERKCKSVIIMNSGIYVFTNLSVEEILEKLIDAS